MPEFRALLLDDSQMARMVRASDWSATPLGPPSEWPQSLRTVLSICLHSNAPTAIYWGHDLRLLYNDAWAEMLGSRQYPTLGMPAREFWAHVWHIIGPQFEYVLSQGRAFQTHDELLPYRDQESWWDYSFVPIAGEGGEIAGIYSSGKETTERVLAARRAKLMLDLSETARSQTRPVALIDSALRITSEQLPVSGLLYGEVEEERQALRLITGHIGGRSERMAGTAQLGASGQWVHDALGRGETIAITDVTTHPLLQEPEIQELYRAFQIRSLAMIPILDRGRYSAAIFALQKTPHSWSPSALDILRTAGALLWEELGRCRQQLVLEESERRHRLIFEQASDFILTTDLGQRITACNPSLAKAIGLPTDEIVGRHVREFLVPGEADRAKDMLSRKVDTGGGVTRYELLIQTVGNGVRRWDVNSSLTVAADGTPVGIHAVARDVTEKREFDDRQQLLINELNHRVKNTLALVQGLALQSFKLNRSMSEGQEIFQQRLSMLAAAHDLLTRQNWEGATMRDIAHDALATYEGAQARVSIRGPHVVLTPKAAISLVLVLHELATNAAKYGALSVAGGAILVEWTYDRDSRAFTLQWREFGGPPVSAPARKGFGLRMVEKALSSDMSGKVTLDFAPEGVACTIEAILPELL